MSLRDFGYTVVIGSISTQAPFKAEYGEKETIEDKHWKFLTEVIKTNLEYIQVPISYMGDSYIGKTSL